MRVGDYNNGVLDQYEQEFEVDELINHSGYTTSGKYSSSFELPTVGYTGCIKTCIPLTLLLQGVSTKCSPLYICLHCEKRAASKFYSANFF